MANEWIVLDGDVPETPSRAAQSGGRRRRWLSLLGILLLVSGITAALLVQQGRERAARLRADLEVVIAAESRAQAFAQSAEARRLADPSAPDSWLRRYRSRFMESRLNEWYNYWGWPAPELLPRLGAVDFDAERGIATVELHWEGRSRWVEWRRYRQVEGRWRRSPLEPATEAGAERRYTVPIGGALPDGWRELRSEHFLLRGPAASIARLEPGAPYHVDLEGLYRAIVGDWFQGAAAPRGQIVIDIRPLENQSFFLSANGPSHVAVNDPEWLVPRPDWPLDRRAQYRLALSSLVVQVLLDEDGRVWDERLLFRLLLHNQAARDWALDPQEREAMRELWRDRLDGEWRSPLAARPRGGDRAAAERWFLSSALFLEQVVEEELVATPGEMARILRARDVDDPWALLATRAGEREREFEARLRAYAATGP